MRSASIWNNSRGHVAHVLIITIAESLGCFCTSAPTTVICSLSSDALELAIIWPNMMGGFIVPLRDAIWYKDDHKQQLCL